MAIKLKVCNVCNAEFYGTDRGMYCGSRCRSKSHRDKHRKPRVIKKIFGVGINDSDHTLRPVINGKQSANPAYRGWYDMLVRSYCVKYHAKRPTYKDVTVCDEWLKFTVFAEWYELNWVDGYDLDKDIKKPGNKIYSPDTCLFIPRCLNNLFTDCHGSRGQYPLGVSFDRYHNKFSAEIRIDGKANRIGRYKTSSLAYEAYKKAKNAEVLRKCDQYPEFAQYLKAHMY